MPDDTPDAAEFERLMRDWITIWQSELASLATDREAQEAWLALVGLGAPTAEGLFQGLRPRDERPDTGARPAARPAPHPAAPDPRDAEIERLRRRIAELEAERRGGTAGEPGAAAA